MRKLFAILVCLALFAFVFHVNAQPAFACGGVYNFEVIYDRVDAAGYAPRAQRGSESVFDCISKRDPYFAVQRFDSPVKAANYWLTLLGAELGTVISPIPTN